ncbi:MAG: PHP domain-containing protein [Desulfotomaculaceae bacterium]|nr:PHP domain-containing protein [Desulfotomaculaceae bacterium]MDD4765954.1 PHP domain-containing protein [Desulfotomaculaceae bacterium]
MKNVENWGVHKMPADMHIHTIYSDGGSTPGEIIEMAKSLKLEAIAITDHDTIDGIQPTLHEGLAIGIEVIPGIELGSYSQGEEIHILGYLVDLSNRLFLEKLAILCEARVYRMERMVEKLQELGFHVNMGMITDISGRGSLGRPHLAMAMIKIGAVETIFEAFEKYIGEGRPAYVPRYKMEPVEAVTLIKSAGGAPVLAHPGLNKSEYLLEDLIKAGLVGIEAYHPSHSTEQSNYFKQLAWQKGLIATGGSDYHSPRHKEGNRFGMITVPYSVVEELKKRAV